MNAPPLPDKRALLARVAPARGHWDAHFRPPGLEPVGPGEESVWDYPRPPALVSSSGGPATAERGAPEYRVEADGNVVARSGAVVLVKETAGAPVPYFPPDSVRTEWLVANGGMSVCEWKGAALAYDCVLPDGTCVTDAAWSYPDPFDDLAEGYAAIAGWFAFYPARLACFVGEERARPQPGALYGGWVTDRIRGPIKGGPGTQGW